MTAVCRKERPAAPGRGSSRTYWNFGGEFAQNFRIWSGTGKTQGRICVKSLCKAGFLPYTVKVRRAKPFWNQSEDGKWILTVSFWRSRSAPQGRGPAAMLTAGGSRVPPPCFAVPSCLQHKAVVYPHHSLFCFGAADAARFVCFRMEEQAYDS